MLGESGRLNREIKKVEKGGGRDQAEGERHGGGVSIGRTLCDTECWHSSILALIQQSSTEVPVGHEKWNFLILKQLPMYHIVGDKQYGRATSPYILQVAFDQPHEAVCWNR